MLKNLKSLLNRSQIFFNQFQPYQNNKPLKNNILNYNNLYQQRYNSNRPLIFGTK